MAPQRRQEQAQGLLPLSLDNVADPVEPFEKFLGLAARKMPSHQDGGGPAEKALQFRGDAHGLLAHPRGMKAEAEYLWASGLRDPGCRLFL
jgi:hypothetical protein